MDGGKSSFKPEQVSPCKAERQVNRRRAGSKYRPCSKTTMCSCRLEAFGPLMVTALRERSTCGTNGMNRQLKKKVLVHGQGGDDMKKMGIVHSHYSHSGGSWC